MSARVKLALAAMLVAAPALAEDYSAGSEAKSWNLLGEEKARFTAKVVDLLCELGGDCADNCGEGRRQLGLLREADNKLIAVMKNTQPIFTGAATDLQPWCGKMVEVDGLLVGDEEQTPVKFYLVQTIRDADSTGEWSKSNRWLAEWKAANPEEAEMKGPWFRNDKRINAEIAAHGYLGLGQEADTAFMEYYFE